MKLDRDAAAKATSWGMFQILGINHRVAGFDKLDDFLGAQRTSEGKHLKAFVDFVIHNHLDDELRDRRWEDFARSYNGPGYKQNRYDEKMAEAYARQSSGFLASSTAEIQMAQTFWSKALLAPQRAKPFSSSNASTVSSSMVLPDQ